jgi:hypothetical protein
MDTYKILRRVGAFAGIVLAHTVATAQVVVTVTYGHATTVPTLSEWGLLIMSAMLAIVALTSIRRGASSKNIASLGIALVVSFASIGGTKWLTEAYATIYSYMLTSPTGGQLFNIYQDTDTAIWNGTEVPLMIYSITPPQAIRSGPGACVPGVTILAPRHSCNVGIVTIPD